MFRLGLVAHLAFVVLVSIGAYTGTIPVQLPDFPHFDKLGHALLIGGLAFWLDGALEHRPLLRERLPGLRLAPVIVLTLAGIEEYLQRLSPRRTSDIADFAADAVGAIFFTWLAGRVGRALTRQRERAMA
jgi:VanZ family protein